MGPRGDLYPYPNGWYAFGLSEELTAGKLLARKFMGQDVVVFRTASGQAHAVDAYCPHLGAHFGYGGKVIGEILQCPFHGFQYDGQGTCIRTGYDTPVPPAAKLRTWALCEQNGLLLMYHHIHREPPTWEIPCEDTEGWTPLICRAFMLNDHPQETTENSVDVGHFAYVHGYRNPRTIKEFEANGPYLSTAYAVRRAFKVLGMELTEYDFAFQTEIYGLGYSLVNVQVPRFRVVARLWVLPTSTEADRITLRLCLQMKMWKGPFSLFSAWVARMIMNGFVYDASQDFPIWENKRYTDPPALARGDGPIGKYRQWAKQFYR